MPVRLTFILLLSLITLPAIANPPGHVTLETKGRCSPAINDVRNARVVCGLPGKVVRKIIKSYFRDTNRKIRELKDALLKALKKNRDMSEKMMALFQQLDVKVDRVLAQSSGNPELLSSAQEISREIKMRRIELIDQRIAAIDNSAVSPAVAAPPRYRSMKKEKVVKLDSGKCSPIYSAKNITIHCRGVSKNALRKLELAHENRKTQARLRKMKKQKNPDAKRLEDQQKRLADLTKRLNRKNALMKQRLELLILKQKLRKQLKQFDKKLK